LSAAPREIPDPTPPVEEPPPTPPTVPPNEPNPHPEPIREPPAPPSPGDPPPSERPPIGDPPQPTRTPERAALWWIAPGGRATPGAWPSVSGRGGGRSKSTCATSSVWRGSRLAARRIGRSTSTRRRSST